MATTTSVFTAVGDGTAHLARVGNQFTYQVTGSFVGTWVLERSNNGGLTWEEVDTGISVQALTTVTVEGAQRATPMYRFRCSAYSSGTITTTITDTIESATVDNRSITNVLAAGALVANDIKEIDFVGASSVTADRGRVTVTLSAGIGDSGMRARTNAATSVTSGFPGSATFQVEEYDTDTMFAAPSSNIDINTAGKYLITANGVWAANATGFRQMAIRKSGVNIAISRVPANTAGSVTKQSCSTVIDMLDSDSFQINLEQDSGGNLDFGGDAETNVSVQRIA